MIETTFLLNFICAIAIATCDIGIAMVIAKIHLRSAPKKASILVSLSCVAIIGFAALRAYKGMALSELSHSDAIELLATMSILSGALSANRVLKAESGERELLDVALSKNQMHLKDMSERDSLTSGFNRRAVEICIGDMMQAGIVFSVVFLDLDNFKAANDLLGHQEGDRILRETVKTLSRFGSTGRWGGDEFICILQESDCDHALIAADAMIRAIENNNPSQSISASAGVVVSSLVKFSDSDELIDAADSALLKAKKLGKRRAVLFDISSYGELKESRQVEHDIIGAVGRGELELYYQPVVQLVHPRRVVGFEALIRWNHPTRGLLQPNQFLPHATRQGMGREICRWVIREAIAQSAKWKKINPAIKIACNVDQAEIQSGFLLDCIKEAFIDLSAHNGIKIEILESSIDAAAVNWVGDLEFLESQLISLLIDDAFTEKANLATIRDIRKKTSRIEMKIDRSFIQALGSCSVDKGYDECRIDESTVLAILNFGSQLGIPVIAEGVETHEQAEWLHKQGCLAAQGYWFSHPVVASEAEKLVSAIF